MLLRMSNYDRIFNYEKNVNGMRYMRDRRKWSAKVLDLLSCTAQRP